MIIVAIAATLVISAVLGFLTLGVFERRIQRYVDALDGAARAHEAMLDQETGLRGYLLTRQTGFLQPYLTGKVVLTRANETLEDLLSGDRDLGTLFTKMRVAEQRWASEWATAAVHPSPAQAGSKIDPAFLERGKQLFDAYRASEEELASALGARIAGSQRGERVAFAAGTAVELVFLALVTWFAVGQRRRLRDDLVGPLEALLTRMQGVKEGDLASPIPSEGPRELRMLGAELEDVTVALRSAREKSEAREAEMAFHAGALRRLLTLVRDFTSTLDPEQVMATVGEGARSVSGYRQAVVWLLDSERRLRLAFADPSEAGHDRDASFAARAATLARIVADAAGGDGDTSPDKLALPMIAGGKIIGVLELADATTSTLPAGAIELFETLAGQAATAIEAARLYQTTEKISQTDGLTGLLNRRRLDDDLDYELARSTRYGNPLSFILMDLDNFKQYNDSHGHQEGDDVLRDVGRILTSSLRRTDSAYRYGGDELAILLRETPADAAARLADRLRRRVADHFAAELPPITASLGIADATQAGASVQEMIRLADANLYDAKRRGSNQVVHGASSEDAVDNVTEIRRRR